ncbi:ankyrin repeat-containing protein NPR4-like [Miscanthus floridulus]|uniref:ankyrin repeat-containing protein NPR4-like n=1 Tax=Miscanthus floridulus TaxID=154761 RepID=UPI003459F4E7
MDEFERLLKAAIEGKAEEMERLADEVNPEVLCGTTEEGNTCLHIASICGHMDFCTKLLTRLPSVSSSSLLSVTNKDGETPLLIAVKSGRASLALGLLEKYSKHRLNQDILKQDRHGCNVLHHAIRNGYEDLALRLIDQQPALSESRNNRQESPMFIAVLKGFERVYVKLLNNEKSEYSGAMGYNALHAAVKYGNEDFVEKLVNKHSEKAKNLARQEDRKRDCPMQLTAHFNRDKILQIMLKCDRSLGYAISTNGNPLLFTAASRGHVAFARALLEHCPDAPYRNNKGRTCLHEAVDKDKKEFVQFILEKNSKLLKLVNMLDNDGDSALHLAVKRSDPKMVSALLDHPDIDITAVNNTYTSTAIWKLYEFEDYAKTINWNQICWLILNADPRAETDIYNLQEEIRNKVIDASRKDAKSLIETYTGNTSLVAILIATITFAAAFTLPGGYSSDAGSEGLPIMARKLAFQAFLIFDTLAMCSSLAVAFICVIARWMDFEFLLHYRFFTKKLMWFAYMATTLSFATGLYTVLANRLHWFTGCGSTYMC